MGTQLLITKVHVYDKTPSHYTFKLISNLRKFDRVLCFLNNLNSKHYC